MTEQLVEVVLRNATPIANLDYISNHLKSGKLVLVSYNPDLRGYAAASGWALEHLLKLHPVDFKNHNYDPPHPLKLWIISELPKGWRELGYSEALTKC